VIHFVFLIACAAVIYVSCEWFVNAVEWLGQRLKVGPLAVGTVMAAFGTALPESVVTFVAVVVGSSDAAEGHRRRRRDAWATCVGHRGVRGGRLDAACPLPGP
jgi:Ca2+/Na+ antiporter